MPLMVRCVIPAVSKMAFGNNIGVTINENIPGSELFAPGFGDIVAEIPADKLDEVAESYTLVGYTTEDATFKYGDATIDMTEALKVWGKPIRKSIPNKKS